MLRFILIMTSLLFVVACTGPGADSGFAPGTATQPIVSPPTTTSTNHIKHGQVVNMPNGWKASYDSADPVERKTLANGWKVEVKYE